ncbi:uncharacterized protein LOC136036615 [Artemia franciscana]|uniref:uncharacterized protein LOC136036615 n=1 Tax=Artemia franciscana TaxID=6661 RepID=UPI0032DA1BA4
MKPILLTDTSVLKEFICLKLNKFAVPDSIHPCILDECHTVLCQSLSLLFKLSLNLSRVTLDWKTAYIIPIFDKGTKDLVKNYKPINMTSAVVLILDRIINSAVVKHLEANNVLHSSQHGFYSGRSVDTNLRELYDHITNLIDMGAPSDMILLEFSKAFDKVCHKQLAKLNYIQSSLKKILALDP